MSADLADVMDTVVKAVNCIKKSALQTRLFASLCAATGEEHNTLLYHSEVRWLSRGTVLARVFELRTAIRDFLLNQGRAELAASFSDKVWVTKDRDAYQAVRLFRCVSKNPKYVVFV